MRGTGAWGYHFGNKIDRVQALNDCPPDVLVPGNLDPVTGFKTVETRHATSLQLYNYTIMYTLQPKPAAFLFSSIIIIKRRLFNINLLARIKVIIYLKQHQILQYPQSGLIQ